MLQKSLKMKFKKWKKYGFEFVSIFLAVLSAFVLNNWNENRKANESENKILIEIANGLEKDILDIKQNKLGHKYGIDACTYFRDLLADKKVNTDSLLIYYRSLTRDFISIQNTAGYETLKSRGLELIKNDSLRLQIISLYAYNYDILRKLEEEYAEMQFQENYFKEITASLAPNFIFDENNVIAGIDFPLKIPIEQKKIVLLYLFKIEQNRKFIINYYAEVEKKVAEVEKQILMEIKA